MSSLYTSCSCASAYLCTDIGLCRVYYMLYTAIIQGSKGCGAEPLQSDVVSLVGLSSYKPLLTEIQRQLVIYRHVRYSIAARSLELFWHYTSMKLSLHPDISPLPFTPLPSPTPRLLQQAELGIGLGCSRALPVAAMPAKCCCVVLWRRLFGLPQGIISLTSPIHNPTDSTQRPINIDPTACPAVPGLLVYAQFYGKTR